jgi:nitrogen regulatory protein PII
MQLIKSIVRPDKVDAVKEALGKLNVSGMTVTEVRGSQHGEEAYVHSEGSVARV